MNKTWKITCLILCFEFHLTFAQFDLASQIFQNVHNSLQGAFGSHFGVGRLEFQGRLLNLRQEALQHAAGIHANIQNQISESLKPVQAMTVRKDMMNGVGGTTVAIYSGNKPRTFLINDGVRRVCNGYLLGSKCNGYLQHFVITTREDYCYSKSFAFVYNHIICLSPGNINLNADSNYVDCHSTNSTPVLKLNLGEYRRLCGNTMPWQVVYRYYPDPNHPEAIPVPHPNQHVTCRNSEPGVCEFIGTGGGSSVIISSSYSRNLQ